MKIMVIDDFGSVLFQSDTLSPLKTMPEREHDQRVVAVALRDAALDVRYSPRAELCEKSS